VLTAKEVYKLASSGFSMRQIREIEGDINHLRLTAADARFLARCGVRVEPEDLFLQKGRRGKRA
jgi:hypothetical protein